MLNSAADRLLCSLIGRVLKATTLLGKRRYQRLLQVGDGYSICEHPLPPKLLDNGLLGLQNLEQAGGILLGKRSVGGAFTSAPVDGSAFDDDSFF